MKIDLCWKDLSLLVAHEPSVWVLQEAKDLMWGVVVLVVFGLWGGKVVSAYQVEGLLRLGREEASPARASPGHAQVRSSTRKTTPH